MRLILATLVVSMVTVLVPSPLPAQTIKAITGETNANTYSAEGKTIGCGISFSGGAIDHRPRLIILAGSYSIFITRNKIPSGMLKLLVEETDKQTGPRRKVRLASAWVSNGGSIRSKTSRIGRTEDGFGVLVLDFDTENALRVLTAISSGSFLIGYNTRVGGLDTRIEIRAESHDRKKLLDAKEMADCTGGLLETFREWYPETVR